VKDYASYTYLGIEFDKSGNWLKMLKRGTEKCRSSMGHLHTLIDEDSLTLPVGQLTELWGLFARSRLLYGSEVWAAPNATALEKLEVVQAMAGRQLLGKSGSSNVIRAAVLGDLGWMSIKSHLRLSKLRLFGRLMMLCEDSLAKRVFLFSQSRFNAFVLPLNDDSRGASWCLDSFQALQDLGLLPWWFEGLPSHLQDSSFAYKREIKRCLRLLDVQEWHHSLLRAFSPPGTMVGFSAKAHYRLVKLVYGRESYLFRGDRKSSMFKFYLRSGNFGLRARTQHGPENAETLRRKACNFCAGHMLEDEEHFLLHCSAYDRTRHIMWLNIEGNLCQAGLFNEWRLLRLSPLSKQLMYLLGRTENFWQTEAAIIIDTLVRQYLLSAASKRKSLENL
jgi:hypothetical protein